MESTWRKSTYSADNGGACAEVASAELVLVRDTTDRSGPVVTFAAAAWHRRGNYLTGHLHPPGHAALSAGSALLRKDSTQLP